MTIQIKNIIENTKMAVNNAKSALAVYIGNSDRDLNERWEIFLTAPDYLKKHESYIQHFEAFKVFEHKSRNVLEDELFEHCNRGEALMIEELDVQFFETYLEGENDWEVNGRKFTKEIYDAWREEVLEKNIGSFNFDW